MRDRLSLQLVLRRQKPDVIVLAVDHEVGEQVFNEFRETYQDAKWFVICGQDQVDAWNSRCSDVVTRPYEVDDLLTSIGNACQSDNQVCVPAV